MKTLPPQCPLVLRCSPGERVVPLDCHRLVIGSRTGTCDVVLEEDALVSPRHAALTVSADGVRLDDLDSASGTFLHLRPRIHHPLRDGDRLLAGSHAFRYHRETEGKAWLSEVLPGNRERHLVDLVGGYIWVGRAPTMDIALPGDPQLSRTHFLLETRNGACTVADWGNTGQGSTRGTFREIRGSDHLVPGDAFRIGSTVLQLAITHTDSPE